MRAVTRYASGTLPVPGSPRIVLTPGHTLGHCALHLPERDVVIARRRLVTLDPYTGRTGPRIIARAATVDSERNLATLEAIAETNAGTCSSVTVSRGRAARANSSIARARPASGDRDAQPSGQRSEQSLIRRQPQGR